MRERVVVIGFDGGTFNLLHPWMAAGELPHLQAMYSQGVHGELTSTVPPLTAPAWNSFLTGKNPGKHGVYDFKRQDRQTYVFHPINDSARRAKALWDFIGAAGGRVVVLNLPTTYPPSAVNGVMISGFLGLAQRRDFVYPPELLPELEQQFGPYPLHVSVPYFVLSENDADIEAFLNDYKAALAYKFKVAHYLMDKYDPHFLMLHLYGNDQICHWLWHILDPHHPKHNKADYDKHAAAILDYFHRFDAEVGRLSARLDEDTTLIVMSDHGSGPLHKAIELNTWFFQEGYLALRRTLSTRVKYALWRLGLTPELLLDNRLLRSRHIRKMLVRLLHRFLQRRASVHEVRHVLSRRGLRLTMEDVDWSRTRAFSDSPYGRIQIHVQGKWPQGCVSPGPEYDRLRAEIVQKLKALCDPDTGAPIQGYIYLKEDTYHGPYLDEAPDITFLALHNSYAAGSVAFASNRLTVQIRGLTGAHRMEGILLARGKHLRQGLSLQRANIMDLCPTILYLMGVKIPRTMDGRVLQEIFNEAFLKDRPIELVDETEAEESQVVDITQEEEGQILNRLRELGYTE